VGTIFSFAIVVALLRTQAITPILISIAFTLISGAYFKRKIGGVTGDCFGAANQITEIAVYLSGVWTV
jgi:adenosylcobinamide-GDP ribazoletransferase